MVNLNKLLIVFILLILSLGVSFKGAFALALNQVVICHITNNASNPYVQETVNISLLGNGHGNNGVNAGDIVPPAIGTDFPNGNNWTVPGQTIYNGRCVVPSVMTVLDCDGDTDGAHPDADDLKCVTPTVTPTATPTPTVIVTPTPTQAPSNGGSNTGGNQPGDGRSDGLSSCPSCTQAPQGNGTIQAVLGASTFAGTGTFTQNLMNGMFILGMIVVGLGGLSYAKEKTNR